MVAEIDCEGVSEMQRVDSTSSSTLYRAGLWGLLAKQIGAVSNSVIYLYDGWLSEFNKAWVDKPRKLKKIGRRLRSKLQIEGRYHEPAQRAIGFEKRVKRSELAVDAHSPLQRGQSLMKYGIFLTMMFVPCMLAAAGRIVSQTGRSEFTLKRPPAHMLKEHYALPRRLKTMTFNISLSELMTMNRENHMVDPGRRIQAITDHILEHEPDLVGIQEAFHPEQTEHLIQNLANRGYHLIYAGRPSGGGLALNSGLLIASRYRIKDFDFLKNDFTPEDKRLGKSRGLSEWANKGTLVAAVEIPGQDKPLIVSNSHGVCGLGNAEKDPEKFKDYRGFIERSIDFVDQFRDRQGATETVALMDGNFSRLKDFSQKEGSKRGDRSVTYHHKRGLEKIFVNRGYKDCNGLNRNRSLDEIAQDGKRLDQYRLSDLETGKGGMGTTFDQDSYYFHHSKELFLTAFKADLEQMLGGVVTKEEAGLMIALLNGKGNETDRHEALTRLTGDKGEVGAVIECYQKLKESFMTDRFSRKLAVPDHIFLNQVEGEGSLKSTGYRYETQVPFDPEIGLFSDHCSVSTTYQVVSNKP